MFGDTLSDVLTAMSGETFKSIWYSDTDYLLDDRPETAFYSYDGISFWMNSGTLYAMSITSSEYELSNGLALGDTLVQIETAMGTDYASESNEFKHI